MTITELSKKLAKKQISASQITKQYLDRIKKENPKINAYITVCEKEALKQAKESDERLAKSQKLSDLDGIPIAVKDNISTAGIRTTAASKILENYIPPFDATVITKLKNAGAIILGKTNLDEFAMGSSTETSYFGPTKNPHNLERVPGGSSGGSAAAIAADLAVAALGSDTGGSIRLPASFCGICGLKPTYGAVSRYGLFAYGSSLDQIGPMAKNIEDTIILFSIIAGKDKKDSTSIEVNPNAKVQMSKRFKIGVPKEYFGKGLNSGVKKVIEKVIEKCANIGNKIIDISLPHTEYALPTYYIIALAEASSNLARYDGIKYGYSEISNLKSQISNLYDVYSKSRAEGFGDEVKRRIMLGTYTLSKGYYDAYYLKAAKVRALVKKDFDQAFEKADFILGPVAPTVAFKIGEKIADPLTMYLSDVYTVPINLAGVPAISMPVGVSKGLPVGLQIIGQQNKDFQLLDFAQKLERILEY